SFKGDRAKDSNIYCFAKGKWTVREGPVAYQDGPKAQKAPQERGMGEGSPKVDVMDKRSGNAVRSTLKSDVKAEKGKESPRKIDEKFNAKEVERTHRQLKSKEEKIKHDLKATPLPAIHRGQKVSKSHPEKSVKTCVLQLKSGDCGKVTEHQCNLAILGMLRLRNGGSPLKGKNQDKTRLNSSVGVSIVLIVSIAVAAAAPAQAAIAVKSNPFSFRTDYFFNHKVKQCGFSIGALDIRELPQRSQVESLSIASCSSCIHSVSCLKHCFKKFHKESFAFKLLTPQFNGLQRFLDFLNL
ncbi:hypothetical protein CR513_40564, partial [Mucuna pruriens]